LLVAGPGAEHVIFTKGHITLTNKQLTKEDVR
jgi:hypothetical protein